MKRPITVIFFFTITLLSVYSYKKREKNSPKHVFITAGQSNTDGRISNNLLPHYIKAMSIDTVNFDIAYRHCKLSQNNTDGSFIPFRPVGRLTEKLWGYDAVTYFLLEEKLQEDFYVIKWAVGGTSISHPAINYKGRYWCADQQWIDSATSTSNDGHSLLLDFIQAIDSAIDNTLSKLDNGYKIDAFIWHQGESDYKKGEQYYDNLKNVIQYVRAHISEKTGIDYSTLPFIFGTVSRQSKQYCEKVESAMKKIATDIPYTYLIDMSEATLQRDNLHFDAESAEYMGKEVFNIISNNINL